MKKFVFIILALVVSVYLFSYAKEEQYTTLMPSLPLKIKDARVQDMQNALKIVGYYKGLIDGKMGPLTKKAIEDFQKATNLEVDGKVGKKTWVSLRVQTIQTALKNIGYYTAEIDAKMGPLTKKAIRDFQRDNNLQVNGKLGPKTWDYLNDLMAKQDCFTFYNNIYQIMDYVYYKDVSRQEFEKFIDEVKLAFQNRILQQNELDYFRYRKPTELVVRLKDPQDNYSYFYVGARAEEIKKIAWAYEESLGINKGRLIDEGFKVTEVEPRSDSFEKGLRENDIIIKINEEFVKNLTGEQIDKKLLKAQPHTKVNLKIISHQDNQEKLLEDVTCKTFDKKTSFLIPTREPDIFCIQIKYFNKMIFDDLNEILDDLINKRISGIILDFRDNIGGTLQFQDNKGEMIYIIKNLAGYFIPPYNRLFYVETRSPGPKEFFSKESYFKKTYYAVPLIGLINKNTASTAELILGALKVYNRITLVGQNSSGAGYLKYTQSGVIVDKKFLIILLTSKFYLSDRSTFDKKGLEPDHKILDNEEALSKAVDILIERRQRRQKVVY